jgi:hypothetical protein
MTKFATTIQTLFLLLGSASIASARLSLLRMDMAPVHAQTHIAQNSGFGPTLHRKDSYRYRTEPGVSSLAISKT